MRKAEFILSVIIAAAVVYIVYQNDRPQPELLSSSSNEFTIEFRTIPQAFHDTLIVIPVTIKGQKTEHIKYSFRYAKPDMRDINQLHRYGASPLTAIDSANGLYEASISTGVKSSLSYYYFEVRDPVGRNLCDLKMPGRQPLTTLSIGQVEKWVTYGYYLTMLIAVLSITMGALSSLRFFTGKNHTESTLTPFLIAAIFVLVSGFALGTLSRMQMTGAAWQGIPFGASLADNLLQILLFYLLFTYLVSKPVRTKSGRMNTISPTSLLGYLGTTAFFLMILAYLLPILGTAPFAHISTVTYAVLSFLFIAYLIMFRSAKND